MPYPLLLTTIGIVNELNELLFIKRANQPFYGLFSLPGGKLKENESITEGAAREIQEELGITIENPQPIGHVELLEPGHAIVFIYTGSANSNVAMQLSPKEVLETKWATLDTMPELGELPPNHEQVARMIFKHLGTND